MGTTPTTPRQAPLIALPTAGGGCGRGTIWDRWVPVVRYSVHVQRRIPAESHDPDANTFFSFFKKLFSNPALKLKGSRQYRPRKAFTKSKTEGVYDETWAGNGGGR